MGIFSPELETAIGNIATNIGVSPEAIKQVISVESNGDPRASTGSYNGLTQIGKTTFDEAGGRMGGMTYDEYRSAPAEKQIAAYQDYLRHYDFAGQMAKHGIDVSKLSPDQQFAVLQGMQFSPNGQEWKAAAGRGDYTVPVTNTRQASALGNTSLAAMAASRYGQGAGSGLDASGNVLANMNRAPQGQPGLPAFSFTPQTPTAAAPQQSAGAPQGAGLLGQATASAPPSADRLVNISPMRLGLLGSLKLRNYIKG